jgi:4-hydroxy-tetrahydrodipicolinate reductase
MSQSSNKRRRTIRVLAVGLGPIGCAIVRQIAARPGFRLIGGIDTDPAKLGQDLGEAAGLGRRLRLKVSDDLRRTCRETRPDIAVLCTSSSLRKGMPVLQELLKLRLPVVSTMEELAYPAKSNRPLARQIDALARKAGVAVLGTGVNPGFAMDALPLVLTAVCERVDRIEVQRVQDARIRRLPFQQKIGAGLTRKQFEQKLASGSVRHVGFTESIQMIGDALGWRLTRITDMVRPALARQKVASDWLSVMPGRVAGIIQEGIGYVGRVPRIRLRLEARLGAPESFDSILIEGSPRIFSKVHGGIHGDVATASITVNSIPHVLAAAPGLRSMRDMPLPSYFAAA